MIKNLTKPSIIKTREEATGSKGKFNNNKLLKHAKGLSEECASSDSENDQVEGENYETEGSKGKFNNNKLLKHAKDLSEEAASSDSENDQVEGDRIDQNQISQTLDTLKQVITQGDCGDRCKSHVIFTDRDKDLKFVKAEMIKKQAQLKKEGSPGPNITTEFLFKYQTEDLDNKFFENLLTHVGPAVESISTLLTKVEGQDFFRYRMRLGPNNFGMRRITYNPKENSKDPSAWDIKDFETIDEIEFHYFLAAGERGAIYSFYPIKRKDKF